MLREKHESEIQQIVARFDNRRSAVLPLLYLAQDTYGYLTQDAIEDVATVLDLPVTDIFEVAGFYTLYYERPVGKWVLQVCDDVPCCYLGAEELIASLKQKLGIEEEDITSDGMFMLQRVKCLAACQRAPLLQANINYIYDVTPERVDTMLRDLRAMVERGEQLSISGRFAEDYEFAPDGSLKMIERRLGAIPTPSSPPPAPAEPAATPATAPSKPARKSSKGGG